MFRFIISFPTVRQMLHFFNLHSHFHSQIHSSPGPLLHLLLDAPEHLLHSPGQVELLEEGDAAPLAGGAGHHVLEEHGPGVEAALDADPPGLGVAAQGAEHQPHRPRACTVSDLDTGLGDIARATSSQCQFIEV